MRILRVPALACLLATSAHAQLTIRLAAAPSAAPADSTVYVAGSFNGWNPASPAHVMGRDAGGVLSLTLPDSVRGAIEYKFTLGSWDRAESLANGAARPNRALLVRSAGAQVATDTVVRWGEPGARAPVPHSASRRVAILSDSFPLPQLRRTRRVWVYTPPGYDSSSVRYPVLYLQDGQNVFDAATSFAGEWGVDETLDSLAALGASGIIVVAVDNGGPRRLDEYDPWRNPDPKLGGGEGDAYAEWLVTALKPYVDAHYRTRTDARSTGIGGSSAGALIALYVALRYPDTFGRAALFSTASWLTGTHLEELARKATPHRPPQHFYFVSGGQETTDGMVPRDQRRMVHALREAGFPPGDALRSIVVPEGRHAEWFWRQQFPAAYRWLFPEAATPRSAR